MNFFSGMGHRGAGCNHYSYSAIPTSSPNGREATYSLQLEDLSRLADIDKLDHLGFVQKSNSRESLQRPVGSDQGPTPFPCALKHERYAALPCFNSWLEWRSYLAYVITENISHDFVSV